MPELAKFVYIHDKGLSIDGKEFPWHIEDFPITATRDDDGIWKIEVTILADEVGASPRLKRGSFEEVVLSRRE